MKDKKNDMRSTDKCCRAALRRGPGKVEYVETSKPKNEEGKVLVRILYTGVCGSDIARVKEENPKWDNVVLGHEAVGVVEDLSEKTSQESLLSIGDKVAIIPLVPCFQCIFCNKGEYSSCQNYSFIGSRTDGTLSEYLTVDPKNLINLPSDDNLEKYVLLEPLTVAIHAIYKTDIKFGKTAVILGAGTIGLLLLQALKGLTKYEVVMVDVDSFKLDLASRLGSLHNICPVNESLGEYVKENINDFGVDVVFEVSGSNAAISDSLRIVKPGGSIILIGTPLKETVLDIKTFEYILRKELAVTGCWMSYSHPFPGEEWKVAIKMLKDNLLEVEYLITHRYDIKDISNAFDMILENKEKYCKVLIGF